MEADCLILIADGEHVHRGSERSEGDDRHEPEGMETQLAGVALVFGRVDRDVLDDLCEQTTDPIRQAQCVELVGGARCELGLALSDDPRLAVGLPVHNGRSNSPRYWISVAV